MLAIGTIDFSAAGAVVRFSEADTRKLPFNVEAQWSSKTRCWSDIGGKGQGPFLCVLIVDARLNGCVLVSVAHNACVDDIQVGFLVLQHVRGEQAPIM